MQLGIESADGITNPDAPSLATLNDKLYLVHVFEDAPTDDILHAAAKDYTYDKRWQDDAAPPSFRPTLHSSIGERFRASDAAGSFSRDAMPIAAVIPLREVHPQLLSISPNDTILLGDVCLTDQMTLILPDGAEYGGRATTARYDAGDNSLTQAIDNEIRGAGGWHMRTDTFIDGPRSFASTTRLPGYGDIGQEFFGALLKHRPEVSYGSHFHSETGEAWRSGVADYLVSACIDRYSDSMSNQIPTETLRVYRELIAHNAAAFVTSVSLGGYRQPAQQATLQAESELGQWLHVIDADLWARDELGVTITSARPAIWQALKEARTEPAALRTIITQQRSTLVADYELEPNLVEAAQLSASMQADEYHSILQRGRGVLREQRMQADAVYAVTRWILRGSIQAEAESLDKWIDRLAATGDQGVTEAIARTIRPYATLPNNRQKTAQAILARPAVVARLQNFS